MLAFTTKNGTKVKRLFSVVVLEKDSSCTDFELSGWPIETVLRKHNYEGWPLWAAAVDTAPRLGPDSGTPAGQPLLTPALSVKTNRKVGMSNSELCIGAHAQKKKETQLAVHKSQPKHERKAS